MRKKINIKTSGVTSQAYICTLCEDDRKLIEDEIVLYLKAHIGLYDTNLDNVIYGVMQNAMDGRLTDLEELFEFTYGGWHV